MKYDINNEVIEDMIAYVLEYADNNFPTGDMSCRKYVMGMIQMIEHLIGKDVYLSYDSREEKHHIEIDI